MGRLVPLSPWATPEQLIARHKRIIRLQLATLITWSLTLGVLLWFLTISIAHLLANLKP